MTIRKVLSGAAAGVATLAFLAAPALANQVNISTTDGTLSLYQSNLSHIGDVDLAGSSTECDPTVSTATTTGDSASGTIEATITSDSSVEVDGEYFRAEITTELKGTYVPAGPPGEYNIADNGNLLENQAVARLWKQTAEGGCDQSGGACIITASGILWDGTLESADASNLQTGDTATVDGGNSIYQTNVTGDSPNCGKISSINNGYVDVIGAQIEVN